MQQISLSLVGFLTLFYLMAVPVQTPVLARPKVQTQAQSEAETFYGTILKNGQNFILSDSATKSKYTLDDIQEVRRYEGMTVKVTGTLDIANNLIYVETIHQIV